MEAAYRILHDDGRRRRARAGQRRGRRPHGRGGGGRRVPLVAWSHGTNGGPRGAPSLGPDAVPAARSCPSAHSSPTAGASWRPTRRRGTRGETPTSWPGRGPLGARRCAPRTSRPSRWPRRRWSADSRRPRGARRGSCADVRARARHRGIAAISPASDPLALAASVAATVGSREPRISFVLTARRSYPDIDLDATVTPAARPFVKEAVPGARTTRARSSRCSQERRWATTRCSPWTPPPACSPTPHAEHPPRTVAGAAVRRAGQCRRGRQPRDREGLRQRPVRGGSAAAVRRHPGRTQMGILATESPLPADLVQWTDDQFAGRPQPTPAGERRSRRRSRRRGSARRAGPTAGRSARG